MAAPGWLATAIDVSDTEHPRRAPRRFLAAAVLQDQRAGAYATDGYALLRAVYAPDAPGRLAELPAVEVLRVVLLQNYTLTSTGREVITRRKAEQDGLPPGGLRVASPYVPDARWAPPTARTCSGVATRCITLQACGAARALRTRWRGRCGAQRHPRTWRSPTPPCRTWR